MASDEDRRARIEAGEHVTELEDHVCAVTSIDDDQAVTHACPRCGSTHWVSVSLNGGWTRCAQCVPCGKVHAVLGPGWRERYGY